MLFIYNTLTKQKEEFIPINENEVRMYVCGPTVYDFFHIGNARSFISADIIRRYLEYKNYKVKFVMNLTDIDDRIIKKSIEEKIHANFVAEKYTKYFFEDIQKLKIKKADLFPKATEHIEEIISFIKNLVSKNFAYNIDGNIYYDVSKFATYGKLSGKNIEELEAGARVEINEMKKNPLDFSLWKKAKEGEPSWNSPWGNGRPGWHIECSAMSCKHLGETFDIHAGGNDLIFPHHENEIAQTEAVTEKQFVKYWLHFGFLNINEEKMSKSLGNFFTAREVLQKYSAEVIRFFFSQTHYAGPLNYSTDLLEASKTGLEKINNLIFRINEELINSDKSLKQNISINFDFDKYKLKFDEAMDDDFNTPKAIAVIFEFVKEVNKIVAEKNLVPPNFYLAVKSFLEKTAQNILDIVDVDKQSIISASIENELIELLINLRAEAKKEKNYSASDKIRDELKKLGIILEDSKNKTIYKRM